jgi:fatty-acyl-CoA synthase
MLGLMQDLPLTTTWILERGERHFPTRTVTTRTARGIETANFAEVGRQARKVAAALDELGVSEGGRVGTFAWNTARHLALYFAIPGTGRVMHTMNIRYFPDQLVYTAGHAEDEVVFVDRSLLALLGPELPRLSTVKYLVVMDDGSPAELPDDPRLVHFDELVSGLPPADLRDRVDDERQAAALCYTTGTTGNPKGVLYSHRSMWLHSSATLQLATFGLTDADRIMPVVPMFHANAWGLPYAAFMAGAALVLPGPDLSPPSLVDLLESQRVTVAGGVPTIWMAVLPLVAGRDLSALRLIICGGSAVPRALSEGWRRAVGLPILQAWGMTEMSPIGSVCALRAEHLGLPEEEKAELRATVGRAPVGVDLRIRDALTGEELPWDGATAGELEGRGPWIARQYFRTDEPGSQFTADGWLRTGDVASIDEFGYVRLVDRTKDLVKSGGEWISSVHLENEIMAHPAVAEAAVIAVSHPRWSERPLACVVAKAGTSVTREDILDFLRSRLTSWEIPDDVVFIDEVPKTSVGKFSKKALRERFADYVLPTV